MGKQAKRWLSSLLAGALCLSLLPASALAATGEGSAARDGDATLTVYNDCDGAVNYTVVIGGESKDVTIQANDSMEFYGDNGETYTVTWVSGADSDYFYVEPDEKTVTGTVGTITETHYYYSDGEEYFGEVSNTFTREGYDPLTIDGLYAVDTVMVFERKRMGTVFGVPYGWSYTNLTNPSDPNQPYEDRGDDGTAYGKITAQYPGYSHTGIVGDDNLAYRWFYEPVTAETTTTEGDNEVTFTATVVEAGQEGEFTVAALNVDGMPQIVKIASIYDLELNDDGPGSEGSKSIGAYIEKSGIDVLGLSENFNFDQEILDNAPSYEMETQRAGIPTSVSLGELNDSLFPFDTDGLNLMHKKTVEAYSESMTEWNEHYSPSTNYVIIDVPDQNGADGMIDKGYRYYQVEMAPGVVVDVYILHMDADSDQGDIDARTSQLKQLAAAINANDSGNPVIVMGDTNCRFTRDTIHEDLVNTTGLTDAWSELVHKSYPSIAENDITIGYTDEETGELIVTNHAGEVVDKVLYMNRPGSNVVIDAVDFEMDTDGYTDADGLLLGDHPPVIVTFNYTIQNNNCQENGHDMSTIWNYDGDEHWKQCMNGCGYMEDITDHTYGTPTPITVDGVQKWNHACTVCGYSYNDDNGPTEPDPDPEEPLPPEENNYTLTVEFDDNGNGYDEGDTATANIYLSNSETDATFSALNLTLNVPQGLTLTEMTSGLDQNGSVMIENGRLAFSLSNAASGPILVGDEEERVLVATVTFTVDENLPEQSQNVTLGLIDCALGHDMDVDMKNEVTPAIVLDPVTLYQDFTVTFEAGANITLTETNLSQEFRVGTTFETVLASAPTYNVTDSNYAFDGWYYENTDTRVEDTDTVTGDVTLVAQAAAKAFDFKEVESNAAIQVVSGLTSDGKATYGKDITFTVTPAASYVMGTVTYAVNNEASGGWLEPQGGVYTIEGDRITGDVTVTAEAVQRHTVTFVGGTGIEMETVTAYVKHGQSGLYSDLDCTQDFTIPTPVAEEGYRLADEFANGEYLWRDNTGYGYTDETLATAKFEADMTITAQAVKTWDVTFEAGENGSISEEKTVTVDAGTKLTAEQIPNPIPATGYEFAGWIVNNTGEPIDSLAGFEVTAGVTFTATFRSKTYTLTLPSVSGVTFAVSGDGVTDNGDNTYTVTHDATVTLVMTENSDSVKVTGISYTINEVQTPVVTDSEGITSYEFSIEHVTSAVTINVTSNATYQITVRVEGENGSISGGASVTLTFDQGTPADDVREAFEALIQADDHYVAVLPNFNDVTGDAEYTVTFQAQEYTITVQGEEPVQAPYGEDFQFQLNDVTGMVTKVWYQVEGSSEQVELKADEDGYYTIPGNQITGNITIGYESVAASWELVNDYMAAPAGKQLAVLHTSKLTEGTYALTEYNADMFWSSRYEGYACFVDNDESIQTLTEKLIRSSNPTQEIDYSGDFNGNDLVNSVDAAIIDAVLHRDVKYTVSDELRLSFDVTTDSTNPDKKVTAQDIMWILEEYVGLH